MDGSTINTSIPEEMNNNRIQLISKIGNKDILNPFACLGSGSRSKMHAPAVYNKSGWGVALSSSDSGCFTKYQLSMR